MSRKPNDKRRLLLPVEVWDFLEALAKEKKLPVAYIIHECIRKEYGEKLGTVQQ